MVTLPHKFVICVNASLPSVFGDGVTVVTLLYAPAPLAGFELAVVFERQLPLSPRSRS